jgi:predicted TIM-barrel fold metal-dependent hydrolase
MTGEANMQRRTALARIAAAAGATLAVAASGVRAASDADEAKRLAPSGLAPDRNTKTPSFKAPPGSCDTHCHIFGPAARYPYSPKRSYTPPDSGLDDFREVHARIGIERAVIVNASLYDIDSRVVTDAIAASGGRYRGIVNIDDRVSDAELDALHKAGIRGCRFNFVKHLGGFPDPQVFDRSVRRIARLGWHVDLHFDAKDLPDFYPLLDSLPVPYIIDHMGRVQATDGLEQKPFKILLELLQRDRKCHVKLSGADRVSNTGAPFHDALPFMRRLVETAPDRLLWGSDWPHPNVKTMPNDGDLVNLIPLFAPDLRTQIQILVDNPMRLYQFEDGLSGRG